VTASFSENDTMLLLISGGIVFSRKRYHYFAHIWRYRFEENDTMVLVTSGGIVSSESDTAETEIFATVCLDHANSSQFSHGPRP